MSTSALFRVVAIVVFCAAIMTTIQGPSKAQPEVEPLPGTGLALDADQLKKILDTPGTTWTVKRARGAADDFGITGIISEAALLAGDNGILLTAPKPQGDTEITIRVHFTASATKNGLLEILAGNTPVGLNLHSAASPGSELQSINFSFPRVAGVNLDGFRMFGTYNFRRVPPDAAMRRWPAFVQDKVKNEMSALPTMDQRWFTVRLQLREHSFAAYVDDRLVVNGASKEIDTSGPIKITAWDTVAIGSVRMRALEAEDNRYVPVELTHYLNTAKFLGQTVAVKSLPTPEQSKRIDGVPFVFPAPDENGNNHIDLAPSWLRAGLLSDTGPSGGQEPRWMGALDPDPARICFRVPKAPYTKLHIIAAATGAPDTVTRLTAQFYRVRSGFPRNFATDVPVWNAPAAAQALPFSLNSGKSGKLYYITIPLENEGLTPFLDREAIEFELTKEVRTYRSYADPNYYSAHMAGLPSGVHVFAITLERPEVEFEMQPDRFANIWTAPAQPSYTVKLRNRSRSAETVQLELGTQSADAKENTKQQKNVTVPAQSEQEVKIPLSLLRYGLHRLVLRVTSDGTTRTQSSALAFLHPDTRERGNWDDTKGPMFGFWDWSGAYESPDGVPRLQVMADAGVEAINRPFDGTTDRQKNGPPAFTEAEKTFAREHNMKSYFMFNATHMNPVNYLNGKPWDSQKLPEMEAAIRANLKAAYMPATDVTQPDFAALWGEPQLGPISHVSLPEYFGEPGNEMTVDEKANYERYRDQFVLTARIIKEEWPNAKVYFPWGLPLFPVPFLRNSPEATALMDGPGLDMVPFMRLPEAQIHQVTQHAMMWQLKQEWDKTGKPWPKLTALEGPCVTGSQPGGLTEQQEADYNVRGLLSIIAYNTNRMLGWPTPFECGGFWGEQAYGAGLIKRTPLLYPKPTYVAYATFTRQVNRANFTKWLPTGSASVFCMQFKHYKTGELIHILWTMRGTRPVTVNMVANNRVEVFDQNDNLADVKTAEGTATFNLSSSPVYLHGLGNDAQITLGEPNHDDIRPAPDATKLGNIGDGSWTVSSTPDADYERSRDAWVRRFPGRMTAQVASAPAEQGGKALSVHLEKQEKERKVMPFYTTLVPARPITIPGLSSHLGLWVKANSDWGRVVYFLRDAKGEKWVSVGREFAGWGKNHTQWTEADGGGGGRSLYQGAYLSANDKEWNVDDMPGQSSFNFDGWRYLRFEMPGHLGWDKYPLLGQNWWGSYSDGDEIVDFPLSLEKIVVERRTHVIYVNELIPANTADVLLGNLYAEYEKPADKTPEAVRQSRISIWAADEMERR